MCLAHILYKNKKYKMKKSIYNICVIKANGAFIYNSFNNVYVAISVKLCNDFENMNLETFSHLYSCAFQKFKEIGLIVPDSVDELALIRYKNKMATFASREMRIVVYPTQDCNLKCWYCYENHVPNTRLTKEISTRIEKFVPREIDKNSFDKFHVTFFGGEPLTDFNTIAYPLCKSLKDKVEDANKKFDCFFVTNGSLIKEDTIEKLKDMQPNLQITIDGNKEQHDKVRIWKDKNKPTFEHIMWAIHKLTEEIDKRYFLTLRINYDNKTLLKADDVLEQIKDIDPKKIFIHFERVWQTKNEVNPEQTRLLLDTMTKFIKAGFVVNQGAFRGLPYSCPSEMNNTLVINYDGTIHKCNGRTLTAQTRYGNLLDDGTLKMDESLVAKRIGKSTFEQPMCLKCKMLPMCMGPCSQKLLEHGGKWTKDICTMHSIDTTLSDYLSLDFLVQSLVNKYEQNI
jgi:uncharacterized protein